MKKKKEPVTVKLYVKTHNQTGMKYLGCTAKTDVETYKGSGKVWKEHIKEHGYDCSTEVIFESCIPQFIETIALHYSEQWDVANSDEWANMIPERGPKNGFEGEYVSQIHREMVKNGTHHLLGGKIQKAAQARRVAQGVHHLLGGEIHRKIIAEGKNALVGNVTVVDRTGAVTSVPKADYQAQTGPQEDWDFAMINSDEGQKRQGKEELCCPYCGKTGFHAGMMKRWHFSNCKNK
ncbi:MAG: hypothetical protein AB3N28_13250 [Kordiimonas sp.]